MQIIFFPQKIVHFCFAARRDKRWLGKDFFEMGQDVVTLDVHRAIVDEDGHQPPGVDAQKPGTEVLLRPQVHHMRRPVSALQVQKDPGLLGTGRTLKMEEMESFPIENLPGHDVLIA